MMARSAESLSWRSASEKRRIGNGLRRVERRLEECATAYPGVLAEAGAATLSAGGKRLRPLLVLLCARRSTTPTGAHTHAAAAVELLHMATLVHDDVLDQAELRRGRPTIAHALGAEAAVSVGNFLLARAFSEIAATGSGTAVDVLSAVSLGLSEGEILQMEEAYRTDLGEDEYFRRCAAKTAGLFDAACRLGAMLSGCAPATVAAVGGYGRALGIAFQIFDDVLDLRGDESRTGKRLGVDLRDGTVTLPFIYALRARPDLGPRLAARPAADEEIDALIADVRASGALEQAHAVAVGYVNEARGCLAAAADEIEVRLLDELAGSVVDRFS
jgi:geranylgeranyl pyrophosphate synthase